MQCILGPFGPKINCRIFGLSVSFPPKVKFLDETLVRYSFVCESFDSSSAKPGSVTHFDVPRIL